MAVDAAVALIESLVPLITGLAWPAVALTAVVMFRPHLAEMFGRVRQVDGFGTTVKLGDREAHAVLVTMKEAPMPSKDPTIDYDADEDEVTPLKQIDESISFLRTTITDPYMDVMNAANALSHGAHLVKEATRSEDIRSTGLESAIAENVPRLLEMNEEMLRDRLRFSEQGALDYIGSTRLALAAMREIIAGS